MKKVLRLAILTTLAHLLDSMRSHKIIEKAIRILPVGADKPLAAIPASRSKVTNRDIRDANADWNKYMLDYAGLLMAKAE